MPRCSVIIPAYNVDAYVAKSIRSALDQTYRDLEVIVVNDGSTDGTADAIRPFLDDITYIDQPNRGVSAARNRAIAASGGEFIAPLDADDLWAPHRLERLIGFIDENPDVGVALPVGSRGRKWPFRWENQGFWIGQYNFMPYMSLIRRELFDRFGLYDEELLGAEDWELYIRFIAGGVRVEAIVERLGTYRPREGSITEDWMQQWINHERMFDRLAAKGIALPGMSARAEVARGRVALAAGERARARRYFLAAVLDSSASSRLRVRTLPFAIFPSASLRIYKRFVGRRRRQAAAVGRRRATELGLEL